MMATITKNAGRVIKMLCDIVSKNGNLLLTFPCAAMGRLMTKRKWC